MKAGDEYDLEIKWEESSTLIRSFVGAMPVIQKLYCSRTLSARLAVGAVDGKGQAKTLALTIKRFIGRRGEQKEQELVPAGGVIDLSRADRESAVAMRDGAPLLPEAAEALRTLSLPLPGTMGALDEAWGAGGPREAGDR